MNLTCNKQRNRAHTLLIFATFLQYIVLTGSKNLYIAEKTTLQSLGLFSFTDLAATMEYYFYAYAIMQILLVFFVKKMNVKWFLSVTIGISAIITIVMAFTDTIISHWVLYTINGALQAGVWGCSIKTLAQYLPKSKLAFANKLMTSGPAVAGVISYGFAAAFGDNWTTPFIVLGSLLLLSVFLFFFSVSNMKRFPKQMEEVESVGNEDNDFIGLNNKKRKLVFYVVSVLMGVGVTSLFFAMNNTLDIFLKQIGGFDNTTTKWITVLAPLAFIVGPVLCVNACEKHKNFIAVGAVFFGLSCVVSILLSLFFKVNIALSMVLMLFFLVLTNGGRAISLSIAALRMKDKIDTGMYATMVNASISIASGVTPKLFTLIVDNNALTHIQNWTNALTTLAIVNAVVFAVLIVLILCVKALNKKDKLSKEEKIL